MDPRSSYRSKFMSSATSLRLLPGSKYVDSFLLPSYLNTVDPEGAAVKFLRTGGVDPFISTSVNRGLRRGVSPQSSR